MKKKFILAVAIMLVAVTAVACLVGCSYSKNPYEFVKAMEASDTWAYIVTSSNGETGDAVVNRENIAARNKNVYMEKSSSTYGGETELEWVIVEETKNGFNYYEWNAEEKKWEAFKDLTAELEKSIEAKEENGQVPTEEEYAKADAYYDALHFVADHQAVAEKSEVFMAKYQLKDLEKKDGAWVEKDQKPGNAYTKYTINGKTMTFERVYVPEVGETVEPEKGFASYKYDLGYKIEIPAEAKAALK